MTFCLKPRLGRTAAAGILVSICCAAASADTAVLAPVADASIFGELAARNNAAGVADGLFSGLTASLAPRRALLRFDLGAALPAGSIVDSLTLRLHLSQTRAGSTNFALHRVVAAWGEGTTGGGGGGGGGGQGAPATAGAATWVNRFHDTVPWAAAGGDFLSTPSAVATVADGVGYYQWASTPALVADAGQWLTDPSTDFGWALIGTEAGVNRTAGRFDSRESATADFRPRLTVTYAVPEPSMGTIVIAGGAAALLGRRRRRRWEPA